MICREWETFLVSGLGTMIHEETWGKQGRARSVDSQASTLRACEHAIVETSMMTVELR